MFLTEFAQVELSDIAKILSTAPVKSCLLDPVPAKVFKAISDGVSPTLIMSAYRQHHSTKTVLAAVLNGLLTALDQKKVVFLVLLDLSTVFDTIDHEIVLNRIRNRIGLRDVAYQCMESYLSNCHQYVSVGGSKSERQELVGGVPQGLVLGPVLFSIYTLPLETVKKHQMCYHLYADDTQLYLSFNSAVPGSGSEAIAWVEACISDIHEWILRNRVMLNDDKTDPSSI